MEELDEICRLCLVDRSETPSLIFKIDEETKSKFEDITQTELQLNENELPCQICFECNEKLSEFYSFKYQMIQKQKQLEEILHEIKNRETIETDMEIIEEYLEDDDIMIQDEDDQEEFECITPLPSVRDLHDTSNNDEIIKIIDEIQEKNQIILESSKPYVTLKRNKNEIAEVPTVQREELIYDKSTPKLIMQPGESSGGIIVFINEKICDICNQKFSTNHRLEQHKISTHPLTEPITCCGQTFDIMREFKKHQSSVHPVMVECDECGKKLKNRKTLLIHKKIHRNADERDYKCSYTNCNKTFNFRIHLDNHERVHSGEKPFKCSLCSVAFKQKHQLNSHKRKHENSGKDSTEKEEKSQENECDSESNGIEENLEL